MIMDFFLDMLILLLVGFIIIMLPLMIFGYIKGIKRSKNNQNSGCWKAIFFITLIIVLISLCAFAVVVLAVGDMIDAFS
jgi:hypothetical protein